MLEAFWDIWTAIRFARAVERPIPLAGERKKQDRPNKSTRGSSAHWAKRTISPEGARIIAHWAYKNSRRVKSNWIKGWVLILRKPWEIIAMAWEVKRIVFWRLT